MVLSDISPFQPPAAKFPPVNFVRLLITEVKVQDCALRWAYLRLEGRAEEGERGAFDKLPRRLVGHVVKELVVVGHERGLAVKAGVYPVDDAVGDLLEDDLGPHAGDAVEEI